MGILDKVRNTADRVVGGAKQFVGKVTGNQALADRGRARRAKGRVMNAGENAASRARRLGRKARRRLN